MSVILGIDTSNYTTSVALYDNESGELAQQKLLLPVKEGQLGLRQSDAVFHHVEQLPLVIERLAGERKLLPDAIGVSTRPRPIDGSYMPCFEVGRSFAQSIGALSGAPVYKFSHQEGHIAAALYGAGVLDSIGERFVAYHLSGGTTEAVLVYKNDMSFDIEYISGSLDLKAGQAVDRVAGMLGLAFPGGAALDKLASGCDEEIKCRPTLKGLDCCLSGVENQCRRLLEDGARREYIARFCLEYIAQTILLMTRRIFEKYSELPLLFAGGVSSNSHIRAKLKGEFNAYFAPPQFSCDNAVGIALLASGRKMG